jgi:hypothetical protein
MSLSSTASHSVALQVEALEDRRVLSTSSYVTGLYTTLLHRTPSQAEAAGWIAEINSGTAPRVVTEAFTTSPEYLTNLVVTDYKTILGRTPSPQEAAGWVTALQHGLTDLQLVSSFLASPEFFQKAGGTNSAWLNSVYQIVLNRPVDPSGQATWLQALANGASLQAVAFSIETSPESLARIVTALYEGVLGRPPDPQGFATYTAALANGLTPTALEATLASSAEYINAHGGLDVIVHVPVPVPVPVVVPVDTFVFDPFFAPVGFVGGCCSTAGFGGFTGGGFTGGGFTGGFAT